METWFLFKCEEDNSFAIVDHKSVISVGEVKVDDMVTFFYRNKSFVGKVLNMSENKEALKEEMSDLKKGQKGFKRGGNPSKPKSPEHPSEGVATRKRHRNVPQKLDPVFPPAVVKKPRKKVSAETRKALAMVEEKKNAAKLSTYKQITKEIAKKQEKMSEERDKDYIPSDSGDSDPDQLNQMESSDSTNSEDMLSDLLQKSREKKKLRENIIKEVGELKTPAKFLTVGSPRSVSPTKEELKKRLAAAECKLQMVYNDDSNQEKLKVFENPDSEIIDVTEDLLTEDYKTKIKLTPKPGADNGTADKSPTPPPQMKMEDYSPLNESDDISEPSTSKVDETFTFEMCNTVDNDNQLFGKDYKEPNAGNNVGNKGNEEVMVLLCKGIYCKRQALNDALTGSSRASHVARRLISGVFKPEALLNCTLTGQEPRAAGKDTKPDKIEALHSGAISAILEFSKICAQKKGWKMQKTGFVKRQITQRLGELKTAIRKKMAEAQ